MNRVKVTRGCAMAWRPCRVSLYVLPPFPFPLPSRLSARLLVGLSVSLRIAHCAAHCVRNFLFRVRFSSVFRCRQSVRKRRAVWSLFFGCPLRGLLWFFSSVRFDLILLFLGRFAWGALWLIEQIRLLRVENSAHPESECLSYA